MGLESGRAVRLSSGDLEAATWVESEGGNAQNVKVGRLLSEKKGRKREKKKNPLNIGCQMY